MKQRTILAIDDDPTSLKRLQILIQNIGFIPLTENNPHKGIETAIQEQPDIILLDIMMPDIDGFEVCRRLKADPVTADIPILFQSAMNETEDVIRGLDLGAVDYVTKPIEIGELRARIGSVCRTLDLMDKMTEQANTDSLTGLPNRTFLMKRLKDSIINTGSTENRLFGLLCLDIDRFKSINDNLGHQYGDQLLIEMSRRLKSCVKADDTVARMGGDEFVVLLDNIDNFSEAINVANKIKYSLARPITLDNNEFSTTTSIGIVVYASGDVEPEVLIRNADTAMYRAKELGKDRCELFDHEMQKKVQHRINLQQALKRAIEQQEFLLNYQPIVEMETGNLKGFEALVRWNDPEHGIVSPLDFIPLAEETGLIVPIGKWVLEEAAGQLKAWHDRYSMPKPLSMSINLSVKQLACKDIISQINDILRKTQVNPSSLNIEVTESLFIEDAYAAMSTLLEMKDIGIGLSLDDFGTGYSSLSYLYQMPLDILKIDRSFVDKMLNNSESASIVQTIVMLARNLKLNIVAEGIETTGQLGYLKDLGCQYGQGYHFSRPLSADDTEKYIEKSVSAAV